MVSHREFQVTYACMFNNAKLPATTFSLMAMYSLPLALHATFREKRYRRLEWVALDLHRNCKELIGEATINTLRTCATNLWMRRRSPHNEKTLRIIKKM